MSTQTHIEVAILEKDAINGAIALDIVPSVSVFLTGKLDPRAAPPNAVVCVKRHSDAESAKEAYREAMQLSAERGWKVLYRGPRNHG